jgi:glycosyltransferase involved in cell wall biosynthesis
VRVQSESRESTSTHRGASSPRRPLVTVVVPVYNGGEEIVDNVGVIRRAVTGGLAGEDVEVVVVSDGSIDGTDERLLAARSDVDMRVIHYDRNLGKGYAVKLGALAADGRWIAIVDADLDLDPAAIPSYVEAARRERLDFAIGSKRHPDSVVHYPRSRRIASWAYQQLNRLLFRLEVRDTQVGLKVFRREVADEVVPLLLVKQFAFDLELLAVARALGFGRIREMPVHLDYRFSGSGVRSHAVARALWDTAAVFYRLRILRTYQRKRELLGLTSRRPDDQPLVSVIGETERAAALDYPQLEVLPPGDRHASARAARGEILAVIGRNARPAGNWVAAAVPFLSRADTAAVVGPAVTPPSSALRERAAAAVLESRLGGGSRRSRFLPGNVCVTDDHPTDSFIVRRGDFLAAAEAGVDDADLVGWLAEQGKRTVYTPDTMIAAPPAPLFSPHLRSTFRHASARGAAALRTRGASVSKASTLSLVPAACALLGVVLLAFGSAGAARVGAVLVVAYGAIVIGSAALAAARFRSVAVGALAAPALVLTQGAYVAGFLRGIARGR